MKIILTSLLLVAATLTTHAAENIISTSAYRWHGDTITQGQFYATAPNANHIISTYSAEPGYGFPIDKEWHLKNDISSYPQLRTPNTMHNAIYNMGLDEMVNAVEPDTTLRTGREWAGVWTRDVSYSILLSMAYMQPEASKISLMKKVTPVGTIVQDTGSGGAWPISSDREIWILAAFEVYKVTGDRKWLEYIYPIAKRSLADDTLTVMSDNGLVLGETSFIDWREQSYPKWMQTADIYRSEALNTSIVHSQAWRYLAEMAQILGDKKTVSEATAYADSIAEAINKHLWLPESGYYAMYRYGRNYLITNPRAETLGESLAILYNIADSSRARTITESNPTTPFGTAIFYPQIADMPPYHNNSLWPWVGAYWALANAKVGNEEGTLEAIGAVYRPAALFATNKENFVLDNGDIATELNSSNMLWCLAGNIAITHRILFGINYGTDRLNFTPFVPQALDATRSLEGFKYRNAVLDITISGYGNEIKSFRLNGKEHAPFVPGNIKGHNKIEIVMANTKPEPMHVNRVYNAKAPLTPQTWIAGDELQWNPIEYIASYTVLRDGMPIATTRSTSFYIKDVPGDYQVIGNNSNGIGGFASEPRSNRETIRIEMPGEGTSFASNEISYKPSETISGFSGMGYVETDQTSGTITVVTNITESGKYAITIRYANGNGPVNTENKCAIRTLTIDNNRAGIVVLPHRGVANWNDWGYSNSILVDLSEGQHSIAIEYRPENRNMNGTTNHALIDRIEITKQ